MLRRILCLPLLAVLFTLVCCSNISPGLFPDGNTSVPDSLNAWLEIDTTQYARNIEYLKSIIGDRTKICVVMKGDAYGNGISTLMPVIKNHGIEVVAITSNKEARDVRRLGYKGRIMRIRLATRGEIDEAITLGIEELIGNSHLAEDINTVAKERGVKVKFHLAINANGMSRNGIELRNAHTSVNAYTEALSILSLSNLQCVGMMTHYPENKDGAIIQQLNTFKLQTAELIRQAGLKRTDITLHTAATYASLYIPETRLDMVRVGSALYNYGYTSKFDKFKKIMSFKSCVTAVNEYPTGNTVSYKRTFRLNRPSRLANIPVGYANGISTAMANKGYMLIRGHRCLIVGNVTMNITMVDVTDFPDIHTGDEVVIYGRQGSEEITAADIAAWSGTNLLSQSMFWAAANPKITK